MKTNLIKPAIAALLVAGFVSTVSAQVDRTHAPQPGPPKQITLGKYETFMLPNGLQVFVVENHKLPRVQFLIQLKNNPPLEENKVGYVDMAGELMRTGTTTRTKAQLDEQIDFLGAALSTGADGIFASSLSKHTDELLEILSDVLLHPAFRQEELDKLKTQTLSDLAASKDDPETIMGNVRRTLEYGPQHPYGENSTEETVSAIQIGDCRKYYDTFYKPNNAYLAIVGDIDLKTAKKLARKYFGPWQKGDVVNPTYDQPQPPASTYVAMVDRPASVQSIINVAYPVDLKPGSSDVIPAAVMNEILGVGFSSRLMQDLREDKGFTYDARSSLRTDPMIGNFVASTSVRNDVTDSAASELLVDLKKMASDSVSSKELAFAKASITGRFGRSLESPQTVAAFAINTARYNLPPDYYANYVKMVDAVTRNQVHDEAQKYIQPDHACVLVVGKASAVADKLGKIAPIKYFDIHGQPTTPPATSSVPKGLTADKVIAHYLEAIGGQEKISAIKTIKLVYKASVQGTDLTMTVVRKLPDKAMRTIDANGNAYMKMVVNGSNASGMVMGQKQPMDDASKELQEFNAQLFKEATYKTFDATATLSGVEKVDGKNAYVVEFELPKGEKMSEYYDPDTGLKVQTVQTVKTPQGMVTAAVKFSDYKETNGVKFANTMSQQQGPMSIDYKLDHIEINSPVDDSVFKTE